MGKPHFTCKKHNTIIKYNFNTLNLMNTYVANRHKKTYILFFYLQIFNLRRFFFQKYQNNLHDSSNYSQDGLKVSTISLNQSVKAV